MTGFIICALLFAFVLYLKGQYPRIKGKTGERRVNRRILDGLDGDKYALLSDVTLTTDRGTTQIDQIIVSEYGIFVIETKNMDGWIFGSKTSEKWTQVLYKKKTPFYNPLKQNYAHVCALQKLLNLPLSKFVPIVTFTGDLEFKTEMPENVVYSVDLVSHISSKTSPLFKRDELYSIICKILNHRLAPGKETDDLHVHNLRQRFSK
jgi:restriction system protein